MFKMEMCWYALVGVEYKLHLCIICCDDDCSKIGTLQNEEEIMLHQR